jgi:type III pantothenate kinase
LVVGPGIKTGIKLTNENPREMGADRICDAVAAYEMYGGPVLVIDYGTATKYDLINEKGEFGVGITAPGIRISANALWERAAKLPEIEIMKPDSVLARGTVTSMQVGLVYGQIGQTEYIVNQIKKETGYKNLKVVATGGLGRILEGETDVIDVYDTALTLNGLRLIYNKNRK